MDQVAAGEQSLKRKERDEIWVKSKEALALKAHVWNFNFQKPLSAESEVRAYESCSLKCREGKRFSILMN